MFPLLTNILTATEWFYNLAPYTRESYFGNVIPRMKEILKTLQIKVLKENPNHHIKRYSGYCRGYKTSRQVEKVDKQVQINDRLFYLMKFKQEADDKIAELDTLLFLAGLNDNYWEVQRLLSEKAKQEFLRDLTI